MSTITPELIRAALTYVSPTLPRDEWARVAMAIKCELPESTGFDLFDQWSAGDADGYDPKAAAATWRSVKPGGGVTIATLLHLAQKNGFRLSEEHRQIIAPSAAELARRDQERAERARTERLRQQEQQDQAADQARDLWDAASEAGAAEHGYLKRKGVGAHGVRVGADGWLLIPLRNGDGELRNVQRVAPGKPVDGGPDKLFLKGGQVSGLWHMLGSINSADVVLLAEGYATAASVHEATGRPVAVAFNAGNLKNVARALRKTMPGVLFVVCGDDDRATALHRGKNPGAEAATAAATLVHGISVLPKGLPSGASDFNDLHAAKGLDTVRAQIEAAIEAALSTRPTEVKERRQRQAPPADDEPQQTSKTDRFTVTDDGLYYQPPGDDDAPPRRVCGPLRIIAMARDAHDNQAALLLEFETAFGQTRRWLMPLHMLAGDGTSYRSALLSQGFITPNDAKRRAWLTEYLQSRNPEERVRHVSRVGWVGRCYVLPHETLGTPLDGERTIFYSESGIEANFSQRGTLQQWQDGLARLCVGNTRLTFAVSVALAGPLMAWAPGITGGGFHLAGASSVGKSSALLLAASVWGKGVEGDQSSYIQKWRSTSNALESLAEQHNDSTLILDELGMLEGSDAGATVYMLSDGAGKNRSRAAGGLRPKSTWRLLFLSSGEITLAQQIEAVGKKVKGGQEIRLIPINAEVTPGSAMESFHDFDTGHDMSQAIKQRAARVYGTAGRAWLEYLVEHTEGLAADLRARLDDVERAMVPESAAGQVKRGGRRFALAAVAGEMATEAGLTGWPPGEALRAARACFEAWIATRGGSGASEVTAMLKQVKGFIEQQGEGRFSWWHRAADDRAAKTLHRVGIRRLVNEQGEPIKTDGQHFAEFGDSMPPAMGDDVRVEYFIFPEAFRTEVAAGFDPQAVARVLLEHGYLKAEPGRLTVKPRLPGAGPSRCFHVLPTIMELDL